MYNVCRAPWSLLIQFYWKLVITLLHFHWLSQCSRVASPQVLIFVVSGVFLKLIISLSSRLFLLCVLEGRGGGVAVFFWAWLFLVHISFLLRTIPLYNNCIIVFTVVIAAKKKQTICIDPRSFFSWIFSTCRMWSLPVQSIAVRISDPFITGYFGLVGSISRRQGNESQTRRNEERGQSNG